MPIRPRGSRIVALAEDEIAERAAQGRCFTTVVQSAENKPGRERTMIIFCQSVDVGEAETIGTLPRPCRRTRPVDEARWSSVEAWRARGSSRLRRVARACRIRREWRERAARFWDFGLKSWVPVRTKATSCDLFLKIARGGNFFWYVRVRDCQWYRVSRRFWSFADCGGFFGRAVEK